MNWLQAGNDWLEIGAQVKDIAPAYLQAKEKYTAYSPHSITKELQRYKAQPVPTAEERPPLFIAPDISQCVPNPNKRSPIR
jgi:hypothetical protein